jgi:hypothetical protein
MQKYCIVLPLLIKNNFEVFCNINMKLYSLFLNKDEVSKFIFLLKREHIDLLKDKLKQYDFNFEFIAEEDIVSTDRKGWYKQQVLKLAANDYVDTEYYLVLDDDLFLTKILNYSDFFYNYRVIYSHEGWPDNSSNYSTNTLWWQRSCRMLNFDLNEIINSKTNMSVTPQFLKTEYVKGLILDIKNTNNNLNWIEVFLNFEATEFASYWVYLLKNNKNNQYTTCEKTLWEPNKKFNILEPSISESNFKNIIKNALSDNPNYFFVIQSYLNYPVEYYKDLVYNFYK